MSLSSEHDPLLSTHKVKNFIITEYSRLAQLQQNTEKLNTVKNYMYIFPNITLEKSKIQILYPLLVTLRTILKLF